MKKTIKKGTPKWATDPFENFSKEVIHINQVVGLTERGIHLILETKDLRKAIINARYLDEPHKKRSHYKTVGEEATFAKQEVTTGFPILHAWAVVGLWAQLESLIRNFIAAWLKYKKTSWKIEAIDRLRIRLGEFKSIPKDQEHFYIVELLEHELSSGLKAGVTRFETLLEPFGLSGDMPKQIKDDIYEFSQVRNLIAHNSGKIDRKFIKACPWINAEVGSSLYISKNMLKKYFQAVSNYAIVIICRLGELYGVDMSKPLEEVETAETSK